MKWFHLVLQLLIIYSVVSNVENRSRRRRRQMSSGTMYGNIPGGGWSGSISNPSGAIPGAFYGSGNNPNYGGTSNLNTNTGLNSYPSGTNLNQQPYGTNTNQQPYGTNVNQQSYGTNINDPPLGTNYLSGGSASYPNSYPSGANINSQYPTNNGYSNSNPQQTYGTNNNLNNPSGTNYYGPGSNLLPGNNAYGSVGSSSWQNTNQNNRPGVGSGWYANNVGSNYNSYLSSTNNPYYSNWNNSNELHTTFAHMYLSIIVSVYIVFCKN